MALSMHGLRATIAANGVFLRGLATDWQQRFAGSIGRRPPKPEVVIKRDDGPQGDGMPREPIPGLDCD